MCQVRKAFQFRVEIFHSPLILDATPLSQNIAVAFSKAATAQVPSLLVICTGSLFRAVYRRSAKFGDRNPVPMQFRINTGLSSIHSSIRAATFNFQWTGLYLISKKKFPFCFSWQQLIMSPSSEHTHQLIVPTVHSLLEGQTWKTRKTLCQFQETY